ncbi:MAG TPA: lasso peptide biosynthesis B2 protein [Candidatus Binatia bacterium]|nr:lasso peptide biosynthesis B2 protein [Candidatus Binatia bacterium]
MRALTLHAYLRLLYFEFLFFRGTFADMYGKVRSFPLNLGRPALEATEAICAAVDRACVWYWKPVLCLQRSAATACLLKSHGVSAELVIGVQPRPFRAHAWVEVGGKVVNDKPYVTEIYTVLDRC